jgi:predicted ester cyclase
MPEPRETLSAALESWNAGDLAGYLQLYHADIRIYGIGHEPLGPAEVKAFYDDFWAAFPNPSLVFHEVLWSGDTATIRFSTGGHHSGPFMGVPATGNEVALSGITTMRFEDGRCIERHTCADLLGLMVQLGVIPAPA